MATLEGLNDDLLMDDVAEDILDDGIFVLHPPATLSHDGNCLKMKLEL